MCCGTAEIRTGPTARAQFIPTRSISDSSLTSSILIPRLWPHGVCYTSGLYWRRSCPAVSLVAAEYAGVEALLAEGEQWRAVDLLYAESNSLQYLCAQPPENGTAVTPPPNTFLCSGLLHAVFGSLGSRAWDCSEKPSISWGALCPWSWVQSWFGRWSEIPQAFSTWVWLLGAPALMELFAHRLWEPSSAGIAPLVHGHLLS